MKIANNAAMLEIQGMGSIINLTLTWGGDQLVLIDTGFPGQTDSIVQAIRDTGFSAGSITHIVLTHQDMDHVGCALDLLQLSPAAQVLANVDEAPYIDGRMTPIKLAAMLENYDALPAGQKEFCDRMKSGYANRKIHVTQTVRDGEVLPICGGIEVIHTPGHTPGHICLYLKESGILVGGDAVNIADGEIIGPNPQHTYMIVYFDSKKHIIEYH